MGFGKVIGHMVKMLFWWLVGIIIILFAISLAYQGFLSRSTFTMTIAGFVIGLGIIIIWYFTTTHDNAIIKHMRI